MIVSDDNLPQVLMRVSQFAVSLHVGPAVSDSLPTAETPTAAAPAKPVPTKAKRVPWNAPSRANKKTAKALVMEMLDSGKPVQISIMREALKKLDFANNTASATVTFLMAANEVTRVGDGLYQKVSPSKATG
jgi:hypothetical protein